MWTGQNLSLPWNRNPASRRYTDLHFPAPWKGMIQGNSLQRLSRWIVKCRLADCKDNEYKNVIIMTCNVGDKDLTLTSKLIYKLSEWNTGKTMKVYPIFFLAYFPYFVCVSPYQFLNAWTNLYETRYVYHGTWAHLNGVLHTSFPLVILCLYVYPPSVTREQLGENVTAATNIQTTIEELLDASFSKRSVSYQ
jgi:hypothetical protein